jgi:hypothetical protein
MHGRGSALGSGTISYWRHPSQDTQVVVCEGTRPPSFNRAVDRRLELLHGRRKQMPVLARPAYGELIGSRSHPTHIDRRLQRGNEVADGGLARSGGAYLRRPIEQLQIVRTWFGTHREQYGQGEPSLWKNDRRRFGLLLRTAGHPEPAEIEFDGTFRDRDCCRRRLRYPSAPSRSATTRAALSN